MFRKIIFGLLGLMLLANSGIGLLASTANKALAAPAIPPVHPVAAVRIAAESPGVHEAYWGKRDEPMVVEIKAMQPSTNILTGMGVEFSAPVIASADLMDDQGNLLQTLDTIGKRRAVFRLSRNPVQIPNDTWRKFYVYFTYIDNEDGKYPDGFHMQTSLLFSGFNGRYLNPKNHKWLPLKFVFEVSGRPIFEAVLTDAPPQHIPEFRVTTLTTPPAQNVVAGETDFDWMYAEIVNETPELENILVTAVKIEDTLGDTGDDFSALTNAAIWADLDSNGSYESKVSNSEQFSDTGAPIETHLFILTNSIVVESSTKIALRADLQSFAPAGDTHTIRVSEITAVGHDTGANASGTYEGTGQTMTVVSNGTLSVFIDADSPSLPMLLVGGVTDKKLAVFRFSVIDEDQFLNKVTITDDGDDNVVTAYKFYADRDGSGNPVTPFLLDTVTPLDGVATLNVNNGVVRLPEGAYTRIYVKANIANIDGDLVNNGDTVQVTIANPSQDISSTGINSGIVIFGDSNISRDTMIHRVYKSIPTVMLSPTSPSGPLVPQPNMTVAIFRMTADTAGDISMIYDNNNQLVVKISTFINDYPDGTTSAVRLFDQSTGQELDSVQYVSFGAGYNTTAVTFDFDQVDFNLWAGSTKDIAVKVDTISFEDLDDLIIAWLDDNEATNFSWGINGTGNYATADISFYGDIYGHVLIKG